MTSTPGHDHHDHTTETDMLTHAPARATIEEELAAAALTYHPSDGDLNLVGAYTDRDGISHHVCITFHPDLDWRIVDIAGPIATGQITLVERITGVRDHRAEAEWIAEDYLGQSEAYHRGQRQQDPLPNRAIVQRVNTPVR